MLDFMATCDVFLVFHINLSKVIIGHKVQILDLVC